MNPRKCPTDYNDSMQSDSDSTNDHEYIQEDIVQCNHCVKIWNSLSGSTSTPLKHIRGTHYNKLTEEQKERMSKNGATSGKGGTVPKRTLNKKLLNDGPLPRSNRSVKRVDGKLARVLISSNASWSLLDNPEVLLFCLCEKFVSLSCYHRSSPLSEAGNSREF